MDGEAGSRIPTSSEIARTQARCTEAWHSGEEPDRGDSFGTTVVEQHRRNFGLWHEEDKARAPDASDADIAEVKRTIDRLNQERNDLIEGIDEGLRHILEASGVRPAEGAPWNTETPGSAIDRLSILSLKIYHMREQEERADAPPEHAARCRAKRETLERQRADLIASLQALLDGLAAGRTCMKLYRQFKMYNDPTLNPRIYGAPRGPK